MIVALVVTASALAWAPKAAVWPSSAEAESGSSPDPTTAAHEDWLEGHEDGQLGSVHDSLRSDRADSGGRADPLHARPAHIRLWDARNALLFSTWPGEEGSLQHVDAASDPGGIVNWTGTEGIVGTRPFWQPIVPMFSLAPPNSTVELRNYTIPPTSLGDVTIPRTLELPLAGELPRHEADKALGKNLTSGTHLYFLGLIPLRVTNVTNATVAYAFDLAEPRTFNVTRSVGLQATATPIPSEGIVRFAFSAPDGTFTAHNNCALASKYIEPGYYIVREEDQGTLVMTRYNNQVESIIDGWAVDLEVTFLDGAAPSASP